MATVEYLPNLADAQADPALAAVLGRAGQAAPFDRLEWWRALAELCLHGEDPLLVVARDARGLAVLPLIRQGASMPLRSLANWYSFWARPVFGPGGDRLALLAAMARELPRRARRVSLGPMPADDAEPVADAFARSGWVVFRQTCDTNHRLTLGERSFAHYWAARPGRLRATVRRKRRQGPLAITIDDRFNPAAWSAYETVYRASWKPAEGSPEFLRRLAERASAAGALRLGTAALEGRPVAAQLWTIEGGVGYIHKLAHDEAARALSPGTLLAAAMFEHAIDRDRVAAIDFGTGDDPYKRDWMEETRPLLRLDMHWPRTLRAWPQIARALAKHGLPRRHGLSLVSQARAG